MCEIFAKIAYKDNQSRLHSLSGGILVEQPGPENTESCPGINMTTIEESKSEAEGGSFGRA